MKNKYEVLVQKQLDLYNKLDLDNFVEVYSEDVEVYILGESKPYLLGREEMRKKYAERFKSKSLHAKVTNRMIKGNTVIDNEEVVGIIENEVVQAIAIYEVGEEFINKVWFVR